MAKAKAKKAKTPPPEGGYPTPCRKCGKPICRAEAARFVQLGVYVHKEECP